MSPLMKIQLSENQKEDEEEHETPKAAESPKLVRNEEEVQIPEDLI